MIDSFPFNGWSDKIGAFWTFGPGSSTGTYVLTVLGIIFMVASLVGWVMLENRKLAAQAELLRSAGGLPAPGGVPPGPSPSQPPLAGPSIEPGD
ncbi:MAG: hypothetical protein M3327_07130 [Actinomycetota bacterium]|nr:hypothetical protein [Actinomycetota bacterium]